jgi:transposase InsO family protein
VVSVSEIKYFVTFIDCYFRMTWIYLMKQISEVLTCFRDVYAYIQIISIDNGTEYVSHGFGNFLSEKGIFHQTSCTDTSTYHLHGME